jgi:hypothetical protein
MQRSQAWYKDLIIVVSRGQKQLITTVQRMEKALQHTRVLWPRLEPYRYVANGPCIHNETPSKLRINLLLAHLVPPFSRCRTCTVFAKSIVLVPIQFSSSQNDLVGRSPLRYGRTSTAVPSSHSCVIPVSVRELGSFGPGCNQGPQSGCEIIPCSEYDQGGVTCLHCVSKKHAVDLYKQTEATGPNCNSTCL